MSINKLINYAIQNTSHSMEFEIRFGKYNRFSSNISQIIFFHILSLSGNVGKTYKLIDETFYENTRKRVSYEDSANILKNLFETNKSALTKSNTKLDNISASDINKIVSTYKPNKCETVFVSKNKIMRGNVAPNYKAEIVNEQTTTSIPNQSTLAKPTMRKYKLRCSWLDEMWMFDTTILLIHDLKSDKCSVFYEVEIEYNTLLMIKSPNKYSYEQILDKTINLITSVTTIIECGKSHNTLLETEIKYSIFNSVVTLERRDLGKLEMSNYAVVDKADGERRFVYIDNKSSVYQYNPTEGIIEKTLIGSVVGVKNALIDCELVGDVFYAFDLLFDDAIDYRTHNLIERLNLLKKVIGALNKGSYKSKTAKFKTKTFYLDNVFTTAKKIWDNRAKLFPYELDGLIFTPIRGAYVGNLPNYKFKPKVSIDVRVMYNQRDDFTEFYPHAYPIVKNGQTINEYKDNATGKIYYKQRFSLNDSKLKSMGVVNNYGSLGVVGRFDEVKRNMVDIIEVEYDTNMHKWVYLRTRPDKEVPNAYKTVVSAINAIKDDITIADIGKLKHKKSIYERIGDDDKSCFSPIGFNFDASSITSELCDFYSAAYQNLFNGVKGKSILVLGCDTCLLGGLLQSNYTDITIIEDNCLEVYGEVRSEGYIGLLEQLANSGSKKSVNIIWGDSVNMLAFNKQGRGVLSKMGKCDTIFINSFEKCLIDGAKFSKSRYEKFMVNIKKSLKHAGHLVGMFLNADSVSKHLTKPCILTRNKELHPLWKLHANNLVKYKNKDLFANQPQWLKIRRMRDSFVSEKQVVVFSENILEVLDSKKIKCGAMKSLSDVKLDQYDSVIANITKYFII